MKEIYFCFKKLLHSTAVIAVIIKENHFCCVHEISNRAMRKREIKGDEGAENRRVELSQRPHRCGVERSARGHNNNFYKPACNQGYAVTHVRPWTAALPAARTVPLTGVVGVAVARSRDSQSREGGCRGEKGCRGERDRERERDFGYQWGVRE